MTDMTAVHSRSTGHPGYNVTRARVPETAEEARDLARIALSAWGLQDEGETAVLLLSELVTNAVRHASGRSLRIVVDRPASNRIFVAVVDRAPGKWPQMRPPSVDADDGRGLVLVARLADRWGYTFLGPGRRPWGKKVWAEVKVSA
ncbi:ATP-binding protein [Streptomyces chrestomyceticus]|uniref:ATP-binding protein n=1 Tax=Streptomyces chrestomyceticus TaxID=68185 RepID=UPI0034099358